MNAELPSAPSGGAPPQGKKASTAPECEAAALGPPAEEVQRTARTVREMEEALRSLRGQADELFHSIAEAGRRLDGLRREAAAVADLGKLQESLAQMERRVEASRQQVGVIRREAEGAAEAFQEASKLMAGARADAEAVRVWAEETAAAARISRAQAAAARAESEEARHGLDLSRESLRVTQDEFASLQSQARQTRDELRQVIEEAKAPVPAAPPEALPAPESGEPDRPTEPLEALPDIVPLPAGELTADAPEQLIHLLNDALAVEKEQVGLLQDLADTTDDPDLRSALQGHRSRSHQQQQALEERIRGLHREPAGGRGLLGQIVTRVWDALHSPRGGDETVESLLKAISVAELEAGMYLAVHTLARAVGDGKTAEVAAAHLRQEQDFARQLRARITPSAFRTIRRAEA